MSYKCVQISASICLGLVAVVCMINIVAINVPHYVDVHLVRNLDDQSADNRIGGLGIFESEVDTTTSALAPLVEEAGFPALKFTAPTTEFPLLFPLQENFFADVLPFNLQDVDDLDEALEGLNFSDSVRPELEAVVNLEFEDCAASSQAAFDGINTFFTAFQDDSIPLVMLAASVELQNGVTNLIIGNLLDAIGPDALQLLVSGFFQQVLDGVANFDANCDLELTDSFNALAAGCLQSGLTEGGTSTEPVPLAFAEIIDLSCDASLGVTILDCAANASLSLVLKDTNLIEAAEFVGPSFCEISGLCATKADFMAFLAGFYTSIGQDAAAGIIGFYLTLQTGNVAFTDGLPLFPGVGVPAPLPALFRDSFLTCETVDAVIGVLETLNVTGDLPSAPFASGECVFENFFEGLLFLVEFADPENALLAPATDLAQLYGLCRGQLEGVPPEFRFTAACKGVFTVGIYDGGFLGLGLNATELTDPATVLAAAVASCEDDETDISKITQAQNMTVALTVAHFVMLFAIFAGLMLSKNAGVVLFMVAAVMGVIASVLGFAALFTVESAPIYQGVGEEPNGLEPVFYEGYVVVLALTANLIGLFSAVVIGITSIVYWKSEEEESGAEGEEKNAEEVAVKDEV